MTHRHEPAHSHGHSHAHGHVDSGPTTPASRRRVRIVLALVLAPFILATIIGTMLLWPEPATGPADNGGIYTDPSVVFESATITAISEVECGDIYRTDARVTCADVTVELPDGSAAVVQVPAEAVSAGIALGTQLQVAQIPLGEDGLPTYVYVQIERKVPLGLLAAAFALLVVGVARWRGLAALAGLVIAFVVLQQFILPALLAGEPALAVAVVGSSLIMFVALYTAHGVSIRTTTAVIGTMFGLTITAVLGWAASNGTHLTGVSGEDELVLVTLAPEISLTGILLAGMVLAGLGVLNDVTVTQASSVWELHGSDSRMPLWTLFSRAMRIGRDHIASTVYTLVFAYAGAALPILLLIQVYQRPLLEVAGSDGIAEEIVRTLVGAIGLVLAVPVTTFIAALVVKAAAEPDPPDNPGSEMPIDSGANRE